jgi:hypothetical protein
MKWNEAGFPVLSKEFLPHLGLRVSKPLALVYHEVDAG